MLIFFFFLLLLLSFWIERVLILRFLRHTPRNGRHSLVKGRSSWEVRTHTHMERGRKRGWKLGKRGSPWTQPNHISINLQRWRLIWQWPICSSDCISGSYPGRWQDGCQFAAQRVCVRVFEFARGCANLQESVRVCESHGFHGFVYKQDSSLRWMTCLNDKCCCPQTLRISAEDQCCFSTHSVTQRDIFLKASYEITAERQQAVL